MKLTSRIALFFSTKERVFEPDPDIIKFDKDHEYPPFVRRKWKQLVIAMDANDNNRVNELQCQLTVSNYPAPKTVSEARKLCLD